MAGSKKVHLASASPWPTMACKTHMLSQANAGSVFPLWLLYQLAGKTAHLRIKVYE